MIRTVTAALCLVAVAAGLSAAPASAPIVTMSVTLPDGREERLTAHESGLATIKLDDGSEYGFRPTILDSSPWNRIVVTIFRMATTEAATELLGDFEVKRGAPAVDSGTTPSFKVAVTEVSPPAAEQGARRSAASAL
jgi:hypothetical protein